MSTNKLAITDVVLLKKSLFVITMVITGFVLAHPLHLEPATVAMAGAALLLLLTSIGKSAEDQSENVHKSFGEVEWVTIFFFVGLFIVVSGIEHAGLLAILANQVVGLTGGDMTVTALLILWGSAIASAVVDNIPFVATMIPSSSFGSQPAISSACFAAASSSSEHSRVESWPLSSSATRSGLISNPTVG